MLIILKIEDLDRNQQKHDTNHINGLLVCMVSFTNLCIVI